MTFKKMRKIASQGGFQFEKSSSRLSSYSFILRRQGDERHYVDLAQAEPDIDEIREGGSPL